MLKKEALLVDGGTGRLVRLEHRLDDLGFSVVKTQDPTWIPKFVEATSPMAVFLVDAARIEAPHRKEMLVAINQYHPDTPILWITDATMPQTLSLPASHPTHDLSGDQDEDLETLNKVLKERFFPKIVAYAFEFSSKLAMLQSFHFEPETIRTFIRADNAALAQINAVIPFSGHGATGCLSVSGSRETLERLSQQVLPTGDKPQDSRATAVAGDLCNAVMGRFKAFLEQNNLRVKITWPLTTDGFPTSLTYGAGRLTLVEELSRGPDQLFVELCLDSFDRGAIRHKIAPVGKKPGELTFL